MAIHNGQNFLLPIGSVIQAGGDDEEVTVVGYTVYNCDIYHVVLDEYNQEFDCYIGKNSSYTVVRYL